jgi:hypothetical protein
MNDKKNDFFRLVFPMILSVMAGILHLLVFFFYTIRLYNQTHTGYRYDDEFGFWDMPAMILMLSFAALSLAITCCAFLCILCIRYQRISRMVMTLAGVGFMLIMGYIFLTNMNQVWSCRQCTLWTVPAIILLIGQVVPFFIQNEIDISIR